MLVHCHKVLEQSQLLEFSKGTVVGAETEYSIFFFSLLPESLRDRSLLQRGVVLLHGVHSAAPQCCFDNNPDKPNSGFRAFGVLRGHYFFQFSVYSNLQLDADIVKCNFACMLSPIKLRSAPI